MVDQQQITIIMMLLRSGRMDVVLRFLILTIRGEQELYQVDMVKGPYKRLEATGYCLLIFFLQ